MSLITSPLKRPNLSLFSSAISSSGIPFPFRLRRQLPLLTRTMSQQQQHTHSPSFVPISLPDGLTYEQLCHFKPFGSWFYQIQKSIKRQTTPSHPFHEDPYVLRSVTVQSFDLFADGRLGFMKLTADVSNEAGEALPAAALLRGPSVAVLVLLRPDDAEPDSDERYVVLTVQPRIPAGSLSFVEIPAGMVDDDGSFAGVAARELEEELGLVIREDQLVNLSKLAVKDEEDGEDQRSLDEGLKMALYPSPGGCDEHITLFAHERRVPRDQLQDWNGRLTGLRSHGERITLKLVPMKDAWKAGARDAKCLSALALWQGLRDENTER